MANNYTFIFEVGARDLKTGRLLPYEYRRKTSFSIVMARVYARRLSLMQNVYHVRFYKEMY